MMTFFPEEQAKDQQAHDWVKRLLGVVRRKRKQARQSKQWESDLRSLRKEHGPERVEAALTWYEKHEGEQFVPTVGNSQTFRSKFFLIEKAMIGSEDGEQYSERVITHVARLSSRLSFPGPVQAQLPLLVKRTHDAWSLLLERLSTTKGRERGFADRVIALHGPTFVDEWFDLIAIRTAKTTFFSFPIVSLAFSPGDTWFRDNFWRRWAMDWCSSPTAFDGLLAKVSKEECRESGTAGRHRPETGADRVRDQ